MFDNLLVRGKNFHATRESTFYLFKFYRFLGFAKPKKCKRLYYSYAVLQNSITCFLVPILFTLSYCCERNKMNTSQLFTTVQVAINICAIPVKFITILTSFKIQGQAMDVMDILDARCKRPDERDKIRHCAIIGNRLTVFYISFYASYVAYYFITSMFSGQPPYSIFIPIMDWRNSTKELWIQILIEFIVMVFVAVHELGYDVYPVIYIYILRTHINILVERVKRLGTDLKISNEEHYEQLIGCIKDHQDILSLFDIISPRISMTMFAQFTVTAIILGTTLINILIFADTFDQIASVIYFIGVLIQSTPCCYQATCLLYDNEQLSLAIFHCEWFGMEKRFRKMMIFFMMRTQTPIALTALKILPINLSTSLRVLKFSFSLYTLIEKMDFGKKFKQ